MSNIIEKEINEELTAKFFTRLESGYDVTVTDEIVIREIFDEDVYETPFDSLEDKIVLDIGANIGAYSIYAALAGATVYAYEPDNQNYELLVKNIRLNGLQDKITVYKEGIYGKAGTFTLINGQGASFIEGNKIPTPEAQRVLDSGVLPTQTITTITLAEATKRIGKKIDVCKVDIEGSEYSLFKKATRQAMNSIRYITMEFHSADDTTYGLLLAKLQHTHNIHAFGNPQVGGQITARIY
jgi:FkbM family methyltransferase